MDTPVSLVPSPRISQLRLNWKQLAGWTVALVCAGSAGAVPLRVNGPSVFGVRPGSPFLYRIPALGDRPVTFSVEGLPPGLQVDAVTGLIAGKLPAEGAFPVTLVVHNASGSAQKAFRIVVGDSIGLTPAMGWNSWNCWAADVDQAKVQKAAEAMVRTGLADHGWTYINIDDTWQGKRTADTHALQGNEKFPDLHGLADHVHQLGLKVGIYSTPWITSYAGEVGGTSEAENGEWKSDYKGKLGHRLGHYSFAEADARQWAAWGIDYLKYDWFPNDVPHVQEMSLALRESGRDIIYSLSNSASLAEANDWKRWANSWRTTGDIRDVWVQDKSQHAMYGVSEIGFAQDVWAAFGGPGHFNDPDMLVLGQVGWKKELHPTRLTPEEQRTHFSLWCMLSAPLLLGCDLDRLDDFTLGLLTNDEVIALDQDARGIPAIRAATSGAVDIYMKLLEDGATAVGFFNRGDTPGAVDFTKLGRMGLAGVHHVRDLWQHTDLPDAGEGAVLSLQIPAHGTVLYRFTPLHKKGERERPAKASDGGEKRHRRSDP